MSTTTETFDLQKAVEAQRKYQQEMNYPDFAPSDGWCYHCRGQIYEQQDHGDHKTGISVESASKGLVTGCPHCHYSYCE